MVREPKELSETEDAGKKKVLVIGLDGATFDIIGPLLEEGKLPNLARMSAEGVHSKLYSTILPLSPPAWTSFYTGKNPGKHGIYDFSIRKNGSYASRPTVSLDRKAQGLGDIIGQSGGRSIVINVPLTYPPRPLNGIMITGFPTPTERKDFTHPHELLAQLTERFGEIKIHKPKILYRKGREQEITDETLQITKQQTAITKHLLQSVDWRFALSVFDAPDIIGHYFWAYLDSNHPKYDAKLAGPVKQMVEDIHVQLDHTIGELIEGTSAETLKFVISDHGFGPVYYGVYANNWLLEQKYMYFKKSLPVRARYLAFRNGLHVYNLLQIARKLRLVKSIESAYATRSLLLRLLNLVSLNLDDVDWSRTRVYSQGNLGQLYLNLKGREPEGIVSPEEADGLIKELIAKLHNLEDPRTHKRIFNEVYAGYEIYSGDAATSAPDVVFLDEKMIYAAHRMFELGSNRLVTKHPIYSGNHKMDGIMFLTGRDVKPVDAPLNKRINLIDLAPTILYYLGSPVPRDMDGSVLEELFVQPEGPKRVVEYAYQVTESQRIQSSLQKLAQGPRI